MKFSFFEKMKKALSAMLLCVLLSLFSIFAFSFQANAQFPVTVTSDFPFSIAFIQEKSEKALEDVLINSFGVAIWNTYSNIVLRATQAIAEDLAAGATGQTSKLEFRSFEKLTEDFAGNALAEVIGELSKGDFFAGLKVNLCAPDLTTRFNISGMLFDEEGVDVPEPTCNWQQLKDNWTNLASSVSNGEILDNFQLSVDFKQSDTLSFFELGERMAADKNGKLLEEQRLRAMCEQFNPKTSVVTHEIIESCAKIRTDLEEISNRQKWMQEQGFNLFGDANTWALLATTTLNQFAQTFFGKVFNHYLKQLTGTRTLGDIVLNRKEALNSILQGVGDLRPSAATFAAGFKTITQPFRIEASAYDIVTQFSLCPDPKYAGVNNCVIDTGLTQAIYQQMTVREAMDAGLLHAGWKFGYSGITGGGRTEPSHNEGYGISNMKKLRRARILPVGWEMAAALIPEKYDNQLFELGRVIHCYQDDQHPEDDSLPEDCRDASGKNPLYHMVDPDWVLKAPVLQCEKKVFGQVINQESGDRVEECTDFVDCVKFDNQGSCLQYGYCTQEGNTWKFQGSQQCEAAFDTCKVLGDNDGNLFSFLTKTLDPGSGVGKCDGSNAGCLWYSKNQDAAQNWLHQWNEGDFCDANTPCAAGFGCVNNVCVSNGDAEVIYLNSQAQVCDQRFEGCQQLLALQPFNPVQRGEDVYDAVQQNANDNYINYAQVSSYYMKLAPDYYNCYDADPNNDAPECGLFTNSCTAQQEGCELYTNRLDNTQKYSAVLTTGDYCPSQCNGYARYSQRATNFESGIFPIDLIPQTAQVCQVQNVGCTEFTNLDEVALGGEGLQYFSQLRQCQKPAPDCATFYTWVGSDVSGFQLQSFSLKANPDGTPYQIANPRQDLGSCQDANDAQNNPNCKEFFDINGNITYAIFENTVSCSNDCHPLRQTRSITTASECSNRGGNWNAQNATCDLELTDCTNAGGTWDTAVQACLFNAIPSQGKTCSAQANKCKEYKGNAATNVVEKLKVDFDEEFAGVPPVQWQAISLGGQNAQNIQISAESVVVGGKSVRTGGYMEYVNLNAQAQNVGVRDLVTKGKTYTLRFIARSASGQDTLQAWIGDVGGNALSFGGVNLTNEWATYEIGPVFFDRDVSVNKEALTIFTSGNVINAGTSVYLDDIALIEATDSLYLIEDSWTTPLACDTSANLPGGQAQESMLGCQAYGDRNNNTHYVKEFSQLCPSNKVGCQGFVQTYNTDSPYASSFNQGGESADDLDVSADRYLYLVNDSKYYCQEELSGCMQLGQPEFDVNRERVEKWKNVYLINNPRNYSVSLCQHEALFCKEYISDTGNFFFKDPGNMLCEYKAIPGTFNPVRHTWYKKGTTQLCDLRQPGDYNGNIQSQEAANGCLYDTARYEWYALDQAGNRTACLLECVQQLDGSWEQPATGLPCDPGYRGFVGLCPIEQNSCTKFVEPASGQGVTNLVSAGNMETPYKRCSLSLQRACDVDADCAGGFGVCQDTNPIRGAWFKQSEVGSNTVNRVKFGDPGIPDDVIFEGNFSKEVEVTAGAGNQVAYTYQLPQTLPLGSSYQFQAQVYVDQIAADDVLTFGLVLGDAQQVFGRRDVRGDQLQQGQWNLLRFNVVKAQGVGGQNENTASNRIFWSLTSATGATNIHIYIDDVRLIESNQFFYINDDSIDDESCNGVVDYKQGCLLFNDTSNATLAFSAVSTGEAGSPNAACGQAGQPICDSNRVLKVQRDRECREFLACTSEVTVFDPNTNRDQKICQNLGRFRYDKQGLLGAVFPKGLCIAVPQGGGSPVVSDRTCVTDNQCQANEYCDTRLIAEIYQSRNTGFSGNDYTGMSIPDMFPLEQLKQYNYQSCSDTGDRCTTDDDCSPNATCEDDWRLTYFDPVSQIDLGMNGNAIGIQGLQPIIQSEPLLLSSVQDEGWTRMKVCRGYPEATSPINFEQAGNPGMSNANIGAPNNEVDCEYLRVGTTFDTYYYGVNGNLGIQQIMTDYDIDPNFNLQINDVDLKRGVQGYCLEEASNLRLYGSDTERVCLTWHPLDLLAGDFDFYANTAEAGYYVAPDERYYCMESQMMEFRQSVWHVDDYLNFYAGRCGDSDYESHGPGGCPGSGQYYETTSRFYKQNCSSTENHNSACCEPRQPGWHLYDGDVAPDLSDDGGSLGCRALDFREKVVEVCSTIAAVGSKETGLVVGYTNRLHNIAVNSNGEYVGNQQEVQYGACTNDRSKVCFADSDCTAPGVCDLAFKFTNTEEPFGRFEHPQVGDPDVWIPPESPNAVPAPDGLTIDSQLANNVGGYTAARNAAGLPAAVSVNGTNLTSSFGCTGPNCGTPCRSGGRNVQCPTSFGPETSSLWDLFSADPQDIKEQKAFDLIRDRFEELFLDYDAYEWHYDLANRNSALAQEYEKCPDANNPKCEFNYNLNQTFNGAFVNSLINAGEYPQVKQVDTDPNIPSYVERFTEGNNGITVNGFNSGNVFSPIKGLNTATVSFYAYDPTGDHMPLAEVAIDWGDGNTTFSGGYGNGGSLPNRRAKCEPEMIEQPANSGNFVPNPAYNFGHNKGACVQNTTNSTGFFAFTHTYTCVPQGLGWNAGTESCEFTPKVRVIDNWGMCSNGTTMHGGVGGLIGQEKNCSKDYQTMVNEGRAPGAWIVYNGKVIVEP